MSTDSQNFIRRLNVIRTELEGQISRFIEEFTPKEIEQFLFDVVNIMSDYRYSSIGQTIVSNIAHNGVKDVPDLGEDGKPLSDRCTPLHKAINKVQDFRDSLIEDLFMIYDRFDVNYTDESGLTHFHIACIAGCYDAVENFLRSGQDQNCIWSGDSPLHLALKNSHEDIAKMLLLHDLDPNLANGDGLTPLHLICRGYNFTDSDMAEVFFQTNEAKQRRVEIDARDNGHNTPLHLALACGNRKEPEVLLRRGADPTLTNAEGSTCLHIICHFKYDDYGLAKLFFKIIDDMKLVVEIEAQDRSGQTPLQLALKNFLTGAAEELLDHGAVFPGYDFLTSHLAEEFNSNEASSCNYKLRLACGVVGLIESLEKQGYELDDGNALRIMRLFDEHRLIKRSATFNESWHNDNDFVAKAQWWSVNADFNSDDMEQNLWLKNLVKERPEEAAKLLTYRDWVKFAGPSRPWEHLPENYHEPLVMHMCEIMARKFFRKWALCYFRNMIGWRLPAECCDMIIDDDFTNENLLIICLAAIIPENDASVNNESNDASVNNESNDASVNNESNDASVNNESNDASVNNESTDTSERNESNDA